MSSTNQLPQSYQLTWGQCQLIYDKILHLIYLIIPSKVLARINVSCAITHTYMPRGLPRTIGPQLV